MASLLIGNVYTEEQNGDPAQLSAHQKLVACAKSQRMLWFAQSGDIAILPMPPSTAFLTYIATIVDFDIHTVSVAIPPSGQAGVHILTGDRLIDPVFLRDLRRQVVARDIIEVLPYFTDTASASLVRALDVADALPGADFFSQGGAILSNSKALFRCVAAGIGIPIAAGETVQTPERAERAIVTLLDEGYSVIVKQDRQSSGEGNLILSADPNVHAHGAVSATRINTPGEVTTFLTHHWGWLSNNNSSTVVVERFIEQARSVYAEYMVTDEAITFLGDGELLMEPILSGVVVPATCLSDVEQLTLHEATRRLCQSYQAIGYRGIMSVDAVVSPTGEVFVHETNNRLSGATYLHQVFAARITGPNRVILDREGWTVPSFDTALRTLIDSGLAFDFTTRRGVIITADSTAVDGTLRYIAVGVDLEDAYRLDSRLKALRAPVEREEVPIAASH